MKSIVLILVLMNPNGSSQMEKVEFTSESACNFAGKKWLKTINEKKGNKAYKPGYLCIKSE